MSLAFSRCFNFWIWFAFVIILCLFFSLCPIGIAIQNKFILLVVFFERHCIKWLATATANLLQSCPTLCDPIDGNPPGSIVPGILQARTLEWVAISFSNAWKWKVKGKSLSRVWLLGTPWTAAYQAPPSMGFSRQEYWSGVPLPLLTSEYISATVVFTSTKFILLSKAIHHICQNIWIFN